MRELPRLDVTASEAFISSFVHPSSGKMRKMSKRIEKVKKCQNLHFPPKYAAFCHFAFLQFNLYFAVSFEADYLGTPETQFETGSLSGNVVVKVPIHLIHDVNGLIGIDIFSCMSLQNVVKHWLHFAVSQGSAYIITTMDPNNSSLLLS